MNQEELKNTKGPLVYVATRDDGKKYIGVTTRTINKRYKDRYRGSTYFAAAYHKAPKRFTFEVIKCASIESAYALEETMVGISEVDSDMFFNLKTGGSERFTVSDETRDKMSIIGKARDNTHAVACMINSNIGRTISEETRARLSVCKTGVVASKETREKMSKHLRPEGFPFVINSANEIHEIITIQGFARLHNLIATNLCKVLNGKRKSCKGWRLAPTNNQEGN